MARPDLRNWLILGVMLGLGGLSKTNYWVLPIGLAAASVGFWPQRFDWRVDWRGPAAAVFVAGLIVAVPYHWAVTHPAATLASAYKFYGNVAWAPPWVQGLGLLAGNMLVGLSLAMIIGGTLWIFAAWGRLGPAPEAAQIMLRVVVLSLTVAAVLIVVLGVSKVQARWLVPIQICALAAGFGWLGAALSPRAFRVIPIIAAVCAAVTVAGMALHRLGPKGTLSMVPLVELTERLAPDRVEGDYLLAGNLKLLQPGRDIVPTGYTGNKGDWPRRLLILGVLPPGVTALDSGVLQLVSPAKPDRPMRTEWHLVGPPG